MKTFLIKGKAKIGIKWEHFEKTIEAEKKERALDAALSTMGGSHKIKRHQIKVESVDEMVSKE